MSLPTFLLVEVRAAFRHSARQHMALRRCPYSTTAYLYARTPPKKSFQIPVPRNPSQTTSSAAPIPRNETSDTPADGPTDLLPHDRQRGELDTGRHVQVPTRVLPKANLAPNVQLSPMQRLHIEHMTRHPPPKRPSKPFKERLLIYHAGYFTITALVFTRVTSIFAAACSTLIYIPSYYFHGTPWYMLLLIWATSLTPIVTSHFLLRGYVTEAFLRLPSYARTSATTAMNYAKAMRSDAILQLRFYRWTGLPGTMDVKLSETVPMREKFLRPMNFKVVGPHVDRGMWLKRNPTELFLRPKTAGGRAARETIPGLWDIVYKRLTGMATSDVPRWRR